MTDVLQTNGLDLLVLLLLLESVQRADPSSTPADVSYVNVLSDERLLIRVVLFK